MQKLAQGGLKNSPVVANELVKFLARNTNVEAIDKLQQQVSTLSAENQKLRSDINDLKARVSEAIKASNMCNNNYDKQKHTIASLEKMCSKAGMTPTSDIISL